MKHGTNFFHDARHATGVVEELRRPLPCRTDVQQVVGATVQPVEVISRNLDAKLACDGGYVQQRISGTRDGAMNHNQVLKCLARHNVTRAQVVLGEPERLSAGGSGGFAQVRTCGREKGRARKRQAKGLGRDLHCRGRTHEGASAA